MLQILDTEFSAFDLLLKEVTISTINSLCFQEGFKYLIIIKDTDGNGFPGLIDIDIEGTDAVSLSGSTTAEIGFIVDLTDVAPGQTDIDPSVVTEFTTSTSTDLPLECQFVQDCNGNCFNLLYLQWIGDNSCDQGMYTYTFTYI